MEAPNGFDMSALCPFCNEVYSANRLLFNNYICPCCNKRVPRSAIVFAFSDIQSFQLAKALQYERSEASRN